NPLCARAPLQPARQNRSKYDVFPRAGLGDCQRPGSMENGCRSDPQTPSLRAQTLPEISIQLGVGIPDLRTVAAHIDQTERRGRLHDICQLAAEESLRIVTTRGRQSLGHVISIGSRV